MKEQIISAITAYCDLRYTPGICIMNSQNRNGVFMVTSDGFPQIKCVVMPDIHSISVSELCDEKYKPHMTMSITELRRELITKLWKDMHETSL